MWYFTDLFFLFYRGVSHRVTTWSSSGVSVLLNNTSGGTKEHEPSQNHKMSTIGQQLRITFVVSEPLIFFVISQLIVSLRNKIMNERSSNVLFFYVNSQIQWYKTEKRSKALKSWNQQKGKNLYWLQLSNWCQYISCWSTNQLTYLLFQQYADASGWKVTIM